jgi:RimJ/RimL family protein N-acetyltransferase
MIEVVPFSIEHLKSMAHQERNKGINFLEVVDTMRSLEAQSSFSAIVDGVVWGCAGFVQMHNGRAAAWAYIADGLSMRDMALLTRAVKLQLAVTEFNRIEIYVDCEFEKAHNWARHLGFTMECERMKSFTPDKRDCALYAMVRS